MESRKHWPQVVVRRALLVVPFCILFNALVNVLVALYEGGKLEWILNDQLGYNVHLAEVVSFSFISQIFLAFMYQLCLCAIRHLTWGFRWACWVGWVYAFLRLLMVILFGVLSAIPLGENGAVTGSYQTLKNIIDWLDYILCFTDSILICLLLLGLSELLPGEENRGFRRALRIGWVVIIGLTDIGVIALGALVLDFTGTSALYRVLTFYHKYHNVAFTIPGFIAFFLLMIGARKLMGNSVLNPVGEVQGA